MYKAKVSLATRLPSFTTMSNLKRVRDATPVPASEKRLALVNASTDEPAVSSAIAFHEHSALTAISCEDSAPSAAVAAPLPVRPYIDLKLVEMDFLLVYSWTRDMSKTIPETDVVEIASGLASVHVDCQLAALGNLQQLITTLGGGAQDQVLASPLLATVVSLILHACSSSVVDAACRLLVSLAVHNEAGILFLSANTDLVAKLCSLVAEGVGHASPVLDTVSGGAMWALSALCMKNQRMQVLMHDSGTLAAASALLLSPVHLTQAAASWLLHKATLHMPAVAAKACNPSLAANLLHVATGKDRFSQTLSLWAMRTLCLNVLPRQCKDSDCAPRQRMFVDLHAVSVLGDMLTSADTCLKKRLSALVVLCALSHQKAAQDEARTYRDGAILQYVVSALDAEYEPVQLFAATAVYSLCLDNTENRCYFEAAAIGPILAALPLASKKTVLHLERFLLVSMAVCLHSPVNMQRLRAIVGFPKLMIQWLAHPSVNIQGAAVVIVRITSSKQPEVQLLYAAHGLLAPILQFASSKTVYVQEQALLTVHSLLSCPATRPLFLALNCVETMCAILLDYSKPSKQSYFAAVSSLLYLCTDDDPFAASLPIRYPGLVPAVLRLSHGSIRLRELATNAECLLLRIAPDLVPELRPVQTLLAAMCAMDTFKASALPARANECPVCMNCDDEDMVYMPCFHAFHVSCITSWFQTGHGTCPMCKQDVLQKLDACTSTNAAKGHITNLAAAHPSPAP